MTSTRLITGLLRTAGVIVTLLLAVFWRLTRDAVRIAVGLR